MKIKVKDLKPNPFRNLEKYQIDPHKVDSLLISIKETTFWDNLLARKKGDKFEIAYGHHRLEAIKKANIKEIDIPIRNIDDANMIKIMANENLEQWGSNVAVINEAVRVAKEFLDNELTKYNSWEEVKDLNNIIKILFDTKHSFTQTKTHGVGQTTLLKFLGANWKQGMIQRALNNISLGKTHQDATEEFETMSEAEEFTKMVKKKEIEIPSGKEKEVAKNVAKRIKERKRDIKKGKQAGSASGQAYKENVRTFTRMEVEEIDENEAKLKDIELAINRFKESIHVAYNRSSTLNALLDKLDVEQIEGLSSLFVLDEISDLLNSIKEILKYFGYDYKNLKIGE